MFPVEQAALENPNYRLAAWTGEHLQLTLMKIAVGDDIGLEIHPDTDQIICVVQGCGLAMMGGEMERLQVQKKVWCGCAVCVPADTWHNIVNIGSAPLRLYTVYAPPHHPHGTVHRTKAVAEYEEGQDSHQSLDIRY